VRGGTNALPRTAGEGRGEREEPRLRKRPWKTKTSQTNKVEEWAEGLKEPLPRSLEKENGRQKRLRNHSDQDAVKKRGRRGRKKSETTMTFMQQIRVDRSGGGE